MTPYIASPSNPKIKWVKSLHKSSTRRSEGVFIVEGAKEIAHAIDGGYVPRYLFVCPGIYGEMLIRKKVRKFITSRKNVTRRSPTGPVLTVYSQYLK